jgi:hypothetical protein
MRVRRVLAVTGTTALLVLLGGPAFAEETPFGPDCTFVTAPPDGETGEPVPEQTDEATEEPGGEVTAEPAESVTPEPAGATEEPGEEPTAEPTVEPTDEPSPDPTDVPGAEPTPSGYYVCLAEEGPLEGVSGPRSGGVTGGGGAAQLPFSGVPVGSYAATGLGLLVAGAATVLVARRQKALH